MESVYKVVRAVAVRNSAKAIVVNDGKILVNRCISKFGEYYALPGGGQHTGEMLNETVKRELLEETGYPGMKVLQFAFDTRSDSEYQPHNFKRNCVVYTGTHDNDTSRGWLDSAPAEVREYAMKYFGATARENAVDAMIRAAMMSVADTCIIPLQDYLGVGSEARINKPSTLGNNWKWRITGRELTKKLGERILEFARIYARM